MYIHQSDSAFIFQFIWLARCDLSVTIISNTLINEPSMYISRLLYFKVHATSYNH